VSVDLTFLLIVIPIVIALIAIDFELIKDSGWRRERVREKERKEILKLMVKIKGISADPDVNEYYKKLQQAIKERRRK
jgi:hypothetical protein